MDSLPNQPFELIVYSYSDYDINSWLWTCVGCNIKVGQSWYSTDAALSCWRCGYVLTIHSSEQAKDLPSVKGDIPYRFQVSLTKAPTKMDLLMERDAHVSALWSEIVVLKNEIKTLIAIPPQDVLEELRENASKLSNTSKELLRKVDQYRTYLESWKERGL